MIAEKQPDLIVTPSPRADYDKYAKIAPTVYIADGTRSDEDLFRYIADLVGKRMPPRRTSPSSTTRWPR